jgi:outer membrane biosynthesis protein TonB
VEGREKEAPLPFEEKKDKTKKEKSKKEKSKKEKKKKERKEEKKRKRFFPNFLLFWFCFVLFFFCFFLFFKRVVFSRVAVPQCQINSGLS